MRDNSIDKDFLYFRKSNYKLTKILGITIFLALGSQINQFTKILQFVRGT